MADSEVRQRKAAAAAKDTTTPAKTTSQKAREDDDETSWVLDIFRVLTFLLAASCGVSYLISGGESFFWGMKDKPSYLQLQYWKTKFSGPQYLTLEELAAFNGKDESTPLYLAVNGTIYDVSAGRRMYGPGGSYNVFVGRDASRAFVTGCFKEDFTSDMRGAEKMFLPVDDPKIDAQWTSAEMEAIKKQELEDAKQKVHEGLAHWAKFFARNDKYQMIGYVKYPDGWPESEPIREPCADAMKNRKPREPRQDK